MQTSVERVCDECIKSVRDSKAKQRSFNEPPASYSVRDTLKEEKDAEKKSVTKYNCNFLMGMSREIPSLVATHLSKLRGS